MNDRFCFFRFSLAIAALGLGGLLSLPEARALTTPATGAIATGGAHTVALKSDGTVWAWGSNLSGQLGDGSVNQRLAPGPVTGLANVAAVAAGSSHSLALKTDGTVWAWGANTSGQLGDGSTTQRTSPVQVSGLSGVVAIAAGTSYSVALKSDGTVWTWGLNSSGQLGDGTTSQRTSPVQATGVTGVVMLGAGASHTLIVKSDGTVWAWGANLFGQLGDGTTSQRTTAVQVPGFTGVIVLAGGSNHTLAVKSDGTVWTWGLNDNGQLGDGTATNRSAPAQVSVLSGISAVAAISTYSVALKSDGTVWTWGSDTTGQLGDGTKDARSTPAQVAGVGGIVAIAAGGHTVALKSDGTVLGWGGNVSGQLGDGTRQARASVVQVTALKTVAAISAGSTHTAIRKTDGTVWGWGANFFGQLGDGTTTERTMPVQASGLTDVVAIATGNAHATALSPAHSVALKSDGTVWGWGSNQSGQLGDGTTTLRSVPVQVSSLTGVTKVAAGSLHSVALKSDGTVWAWGSNSGQLGDGTSIQNELPVQASGLTNATAIAAGKNHTVALKNDGTVWTWGVNSNGQLGDGTTTQRLTPTQASGLSGITAISAGSAHTLGLKSDGTVWAWGLNTNGQLGDNTTTQRTAAVQIAGLSSITAIAAGTSHSVALKSDGTVWAWGLNTSGQLGDGTTTQRNAPVQIPGLANIVAVAAGGSHTLALKNDGTLWGCGLNGNEQLGFSSFQITQAAIRLTSAGSDTDQDGMSDAWEIQYFGNLTHDGSADSDGDGLTDIQEFFRGTNPVQADSDGDSLTDFVDAAPGDYYNGAAPTLAIVSGNNQSANVSQFNAQPFDVAVFNPAGTTPLQNAPVTFSVTQGGGSLALTNAGSPPLSPTLTLRTDQDGTAQVFYHQSATGGILSQILAQAGASQVTFSSTSIATTSPGDADGNGLPDAWENQYFGHTGVSPTGDLDGDGLSNLQEYNNGTDPTDFYNGVAPVFGSLVNSSSLSVRVSGYNGRSAGPILLGDANTAIQTASAHVIAASLRPDGLAADGSTPATLAETANAVSILLTKPNGDPYANAPVMFTVINGDSLIAATSAGTGAKTLKVNTDANGIARVYVVSTASPAGDLLISPAGSNPANALAALLASSFTAIDLGDGTPIGIAADGTITLRTDGGLVRWHNGVRTPLEVPASIYTYTSTGGGSRQNYVHPPFDMFFPEYGSGNLLSDGSVFAVAADRLLSGRLLAEESFVVRWSPDSATPATTIKAPVLTFPNMGEGQPFDNEAQSFLYPIAVDPSGLLWAHTGDSLPKIYSPNGSVANAFSTSQLAGVGVQTVDDVIASYYLVVNDVNSAGQAVGSFNDQSFNLHFFVGAPTSTVNFVPLAINEAGQVLGDDYDASQFFYSYGFGNILRKPDGYTPNFLQQAPGYVALKPFVQSQGVKTYLKTPTGTTDIILVGMDEAGNVYGAVDGQNVIWVAQPTAWGLAANTPIYSPMLWEQPTIAGGFESLSGIRPSTSGAQVVMAQTTDATGATVERATLVTRLELAVDANRDGSIKFASEDATDAPTAEKPYRFWINDDDDESFQDPKWSDRDPERYPPTQADSANQIVDSVRDCEDLTRIWIDAAGLIDTAKNTSSDLYLGLKWRNTNGTHPSIRLFRSADPNGGLGHIKNTRIGTEQAAGVSGTGAVTDMRVCLGDADAQATGPTVDEPWTGITTVEPPTDAGDIRAADFIFRKDALPSVFGNRTTGYLLFEGVQEGKGELMLVLVKKSGERWEKVSEGGSVWLQLDNIRRMYVRVHSEPTADHFPLPWEFGDSPPSLYMEMPSSDHAITIDPSNLGWGPGDTAENPNQFSFAPSAGEDPKKCIVFVHGIDMTVPEVRGYSESFFKRLWWEGYRGRFVSFRWSTILSGDGFWSSALSVPVYLNTSVFNSGEYRSWKSGLALKKYFDALRTQLGATATISVVGHSLGNAAVGEALRQGMRPNSYVAMEAAVSLSSYYWSDPQSGEPVPPSNPQLENAEAGHPTPLKTGSGGYYGYLASLQTIAGLNRVSYYNGNDFWLATGTTADTFWVGPVHVGVKNVDWVTNQATTKPDDRYGPGRYSYDSSIDWAQFARGATFARSVVDPHERMPFVSRSLTSALGASLSPPNFSGWNLGQDYGFTTQRPDHSGQFQRSIQLMYAKEDGTPWPSGEPLYARLMRDLRVSP